MVSEYDRLKCVSFHGNKQINIMVFALTVLGLISQFIYSSMGLKINIQLLFFVDFFALVSAILLFQYLWAKVLTGQSLFSGIYLISTFSVLIAMRLAYYADMTVSFWCYVLVIILKCINFILVARSDLQEMRLDVSNKYRHCCHYEWQLLFIRLFIGFDLVPHFCEKLFAGAAIRQVDIAAFSQLGVPHADAFVWLAGLIEFAAAFAIGCGLITRLASFLFVLYLMVATGMGHHFQLGFIWASKGGGWEYPVLWSALIASFIFFGAGGFSIDQLLRERFRVPKWLLHCMGSRHW